MSVAELSHFQKTAERLGRGQLVLPIIYIEVEDLNSDESDPLKVAVAATQFEDWTDLRFADRASSEYRRGVNRLATALRDRLHALPDPAVGAAVAAVSAIAPDAENNEDPDAPGLLDLIVENEGAVEEMTAALQGIAEVTKELGAKARKFTPRLKEEKSGSQNLANRVIVIAEFANEMEPLVDQLEARVGTYLTNLDRVDALYRALLSTGTAEPNRESARALAEVVIDMAVTGRESFASVDGLISAVQGMENYSRSIRNPSRRLRQSLRTLRDSEPILHSWAASATSLLDQLDAADELS